MRMQSRIVIVSGLVLAAVGGWWWLDQSTRPAETDSRAPGVVPGQVSTFERPTLGPGSGDATGDASSPGGSASDGMADAGVPGEASPAEPLTASDILAQPDEDNVRVAKKLAALVRDGNASPEVREEALAHTLNLAAGNEAEVLPPIVTDPQVPDGLAETVLSEALNQSLSYQADLYLTALAARKSPEMQTMIREHLAFLTDGPDLGGDPVAWKKAVEAAKKNWDQDN